MLIKTIKVTNFLPFQGDQELEFSTDPERNVTLVMGDNGAGKTSLAQAFEWCLYGRTPEETRNVMNAFVQERIKPGSGRYVKVEIVLEKDGTTFVLERKQKYSRSENGKMDRPGQQEFEIQYKQDGETFRVPPNERESTIKSLLASELSHYFFFDGEHVKNMRREIEHGKSSDFADAVKTILGLQPIAAALDHLRAPGPKSSVERWFRSQFDTEGNQDLEKKRQRIGLLEKRIVSLQEDMEDAEADEGAARANVAQYEQLLQENSESEKAQRDVKRAKRQQANAVQAYITKRDAAFKLFKGQHYRMFAERLIGDALEELADEEKINKGVPSVDDKTIKFILERKECLCGTKFETGDDVFQTLCELLEYVPPKDLGTYISQFDNECHVRTEGEFTFVDDIGNAYRDFAEAEDSVMTADRALSSALAYLASINNVDVKHLRKNLDAANIDVRRAAEKLGVARRQKIDAEREIETLQTEIASYSVKNAKNREVSECLQYVDYIYDFLNVFYSSHEAEARNELKDAVNKYFTAMYDGEMHLELDENYGVTVKVDEINERTEAWKTSSGQTLGIILAFILGILDIAKKTKKSEDGLMKGDTYPLVMDAPLSDFDKTRIDAICKLLPEVAEQVIIIIKDTDGDLAEEHMQGKIGRRYSIEHVTDYESVIKE